MTTATTTLPEQITTTTPVATTDEDGFRTPAIKFETQTTAELSTTTTPPTTSQPPHCKLSGWANGVGLHVDATAHFSS